MTVRRLLQIVRGDGYIYRHRAGMLQYRSATGVWLNYMSVDDAIRDIEHDRDIAVERIEDAMIQMLADENV